MLRPLCVCCTALVLTLCIAAPAQNPVYELGEKPHTVQVRILALSSAARQAFAGSQDTYFAEIVKHGEENGELVKLVDRYPNYDAPIRRSVLQAQHPLHVRLKRDESCDARADVMHVSVERTDAFDRSLPAKLHADGSQLLACFMIDHAATRLTK